MKIEMIERFGYPLSEKIGEFTKAKRIFLNREEIESIILEFHNSIDEDKEYFLMLLHAASINIIGRILRMKSLRDPIKYSFDDIKQELFIVLIESIEKYNPYESEFDFYGFFIYESKNYFKERRTKDKIYEINMDIDNNECVIASRKILDVELDDYLKKELDDRHYKVCILKSGMYGKFTNKEIAKMLNISFRTVEDDWRFCKCHLKNDEFFKNFLKGGE